jgi:hypothetical protein
MPHFERRDAMAKRTADQEEEKLDAGVVVDSVGVMNTPERNKEDGRLLPCTCLTVSDSPRVSSIIGLAADYFVSESAFFVTKSGKNKEGVGPQREDTQGRRHSFSDYARTAGLR